MLSLPENVRLGTDWADVSFYAGERAEKSAKALDPALFENARAENGFVNADLTEKGLLALLSDVRVQKVRKRVEELTEEELFSPVWLYYWTSVRRANAERVRRCPFLPAGRRKLLLRLVAAFRGSFALSEELALCGRVIRELHASFIPEEDDGLSLLCTAACALLGRRLDGGTP